MSVIDEMYKKYSVKKKRECEFTAAFLWCTIPKKCKDCVLANTKIYPPFTAEKQLELIKLIGKTLTSTECSDRLWDILWRNDFKEALANRVNLLYQDLTSKQHQEVKEILER